jgi:hypothetical protein
MSEAEEESRQQRLQELHDQISANTRYTAPPAEEADLWLTGVTDFDLPNGTTKYGVPTWILKSHYWAWHRLRFPHLPYPDDAT